MCPLVVNQESWMKTRIKEDEFRKYLNQGSDFIPDEEIIEILNNQKAADSFQVRDIISKSLTIQTLTPQETAVLLSVQNKDLLIQMRETALKIKKYVYDNRIVTFAPLYMGNLCVNNCSYCGFRKDNQIVKRKQLTLEEVKRETEVLAGEIGHKRLIVVYGEHPRSDIDYMVSTIEAIYGVKVKPVRYSPPEADNNPSFSGTISNGVKTKHAWVNIRRVNVNAPPLSIEDLKKLHTAGLGTYQVFQETYHHQTYGNMHPKGTLKGNYQWRLYCMHRAMEAGIDDVGIGVLFGLYDWKFEVMGLVYHARELEEKFGIGPHTISFPRIEPAVNTPLTISSKYKVSDDDFKKIIIVLRLAIPYTGMILTARENSQMRKDIIPLGITQTDASTKIGIGSYSKGNYGQEQDKQQFLLGDTRSLDEVVRQLLEMGYITSFCTAGYRCSRTGKCIMDLLRSGQEGKFCKLNAVLTFREWLDDFASEKTKILGEEIINREIAEIKKINPRILPAFMEYYERISKGERDLYL